MNLDPTLARAIILATSFRGAAMHRCQAALLMIGLNGLDFDAGMLPGEIATKDDGTPDAQMAGMACASLASQGLLEAVGRVRSSNPLANGRKINLYRIPAAKVTTVRTWLQRHGYPAGQNEQTALAI
jgi:hypothetical protein